MKEKKARVEDAMSATRAAVEEGIVAGGGVALLRCLSRLEGVEAPDDERVGVNIIRRALQEPLKQIASNAGIDGAIAVQRVIGGEGGFGYNAATGRYEDLFGAGIIDPVKVVRAALQNAASVAGLMITTEALVTDKPRRGHDASGGAGRRR
jgi:chaperonin GroEL